MIAKYDGYCKVTGQKIVAGKTEIVKVNGKWQAKGQPVAQGTIVTKHGNQYSAQEWTEMQAQFTARQEENDAIDEHNERIMKEAADALTADGVTGNTYGICWKIFNGAEVSFTSDTRRQIVERMMSQLK